MKSILTISNSQIHECYEIAKKFEEQFPQKDDYYLYFLDFYNALQTKAEFFVKIDYITENDPPLDLEALYITLGVLAGVIVFIIVVVMLCKYYNKIDEEDD